MEKAQNQLETVRIDTKLEVLTLQREADAAVAEAQVLENAEVMQIEVEKCKSESEKVKADRTSEYVQSQIDLQILHPPIRRSSVLPVAFPLRAESHASFITWIPPEKNISQQIDGQLKPVKSDNIHLPAPEEPEWTKVETKSEASRPNPTMNIHAQSYTPQHIPRASSPATMEPLAQYLARRDLVSSGLYQFDDKPENFRAWYSSFTSAVREVHLTATQELDLMTKWLGKESGEQIKRIRSVHVSNPSLALHRAWQRLHECYAAPEIIEESLFQRLDSFPKITAKEHTKLRELGDLLMEIQGAKEDGYLTGLSYLDTSRVIGPIVDKLPYVLQDNWVSTGYRFKVENHGRFPPFEYFCRYFLSPRTMFINLWLPVAKITFNAVFYQY
ncbi:hypothetical protein KUCAC02_029408 [Chaenocephalus aceratus]|nr:hypothetical protein KUCAC02_029408 [Chaenocephalus aceratus]